MAEKKEEPKKQQKTEKKKELKPYKSSKMCPKCNSRMADHTDRYACGKCGYTEFKQSKQ